MGGREDERKVADRIDAELLQNGQRKRERFAGSCFGGTNAIGARKNVRDTVALNGRRLFEAWCIRKIIIILSINP